MTCRHPRFVVKFFSPKLHIKWWQALDNISQRFVVLDFFQVLESDRLASVHSKTSSSVIDNDLHSMALVANYNVRDGHVDIRIYANGVDSHQCIWTYRSKIPELDIQDPCTLPTIPTHLLSAFTLHTMRGHRNSQRSSWGQTNYRHRYVIWHWWNALPPCEWGW